MSKSTSLENAVLTAAYINGTFGAALYVGVSGVIPDVGGAGFTEPSGGGYARKQFDPGTTNWNNPSGGAITNKLRVELAAATGAWLSGDEIKAFAIFDASTGGNMLHWGALISGAAEAVTDPDNDRIQAPGHGFDADDVVTVYNPYGDLPAGLTAGAKYYVGDVLTDSFTLNDAPAAESPNIIDITGWGELVVGIVRFTTIANGQSFVIEAGDLAISEG